MEGNVHTANRWPPRAPRIFETIKEEGLHKWNAVLRRIGNDWRQAVENDAPAPKQIREWWSRLRKNEGRDIAKLFDDVGTCRILLQLLAAADEACTNIGIPTPTDWTNQPSKLDPVIALSRT